MASPSSPDVPVVALVLGAAVWESGRASPTLERRARHAARLYLEEHVVHVIGCGGIGRFPPSEASLICRICQDAGIADTALHAEDRSTNTLENIAFALPILQGIGTDRVCIVTDGYHLPRAQLIARRMGLRCQPAPPPPPGPITARKIKAVLREAIAYLWYMLRAPSARP